VEVVVSKVLRASAVVVSAALAVPLWAVPAHAAAASETASVGAYFFRGGVTQPAGTPDSPQPIPNVTATTADGVAPGNLAVAAQGGQEDKVSFLRFDLAEAPLDATIDSALLAVPLVPSSPPQNIAYNEAPELVRVCKAGDSGFFGEDGANITLAPERLCEEFASEPGKLSTDGKAYVFDVTGLASMWLEANDGLALTVAEGAESSQFQVVFAPSTEAPLAYSFCGVPEVIDVAPELPVDDSTSDSGFIGSLPPVDSGFGSTESPLVDTALPEPAPAAQAAPEPAVAAPVRNVAVITEASLTPSTGFWAALLALLGIGALLSLIMGDSRVAAPSSVTGQSRLSKALAGRETASLARGPRLARPVTP
jgi:hypothetical protein